MSLLHPSDTDEGAVPARVRRFFRNRLFELCGLLLLLASLLTGLALATWSPADPILNGGDGFSVNWLGTVGAYLSDGLLRSFGVASVLCFVIPAIWSAQLFSHTLPRRLVWSATYWLAAIAVGSTLTSLILPKVATQLVSGPGGGTGAFFADNLTVLLPYIFENRLSSGIATTVIGFIGLQFFISASGGNSTNLLRSLFDWHLRSEYQKCFGLVFHLFLVAKSRLIRTFAKRWLEIGQSPGQEDGGYWPREPQLLSAKVFEDGDYQEEEHDTIGSPRIERTRKPIRAGKRAKADDQPSFFPLRDSFSLPPLPLLAEPRVAGRASDLSDEALEQNARFLEGVLDDFGVRGEITKVHPGPVVTLYELEPAPGIKSSRVIGLADDIARSMSAISARVAVIPGRNAIGIELPNQKRETVFLRELLASETFEKSNQGLCLALGKNIGGEPVFADLARMPHLLIAGTTGSGKSVGINTMILSLLYRMPPESCRLIMIDPKMLELSVYEGIPHLLAPVVTDPRKAVVALKWAVREMEERYRKMSKLGVRNIDGYNARLKQAIAKGEILGRTVQTGYDPETGQPVFETEQIDMKSMPFIVVIIDEMADLMMVAGKDIEGAVQRLAQMARAAGIHVVMATQRPSVDVITGTIKANFPTRISFQVTSKIDSRTILGEQGAEQLLGQGDMLYMMGGGRINRLHSPFVTDEEVERVVRHLRSQGVPDYVNGVTEESGGEVEDNQLIGAVSGDALYDQAVAVVLRDRKVSTSYIQRRLQIGYNKAASLIERMEREGLISVANATGKREILVDGEAA